MEQITTTINETTEPLGIKHKLLMIIKNLFIRLTPLCMRHTKEVTKEATDTIMETITLD